MATPARRAGDDDDRGVEDLMAILRTVISGARTAGGTGLTVLADGAERALSTFIRSRVDRVIAQPAPASSKARAGLADRLAPPKGSAVTRRLGRSGVARVVRRAGPLARRSPAALALRVGPAMYDLVTEALREVDAVASELVAVARDNGRDPDPHSVHVATVQVLVGRPVDGDAVDEPDHSALVRRWAKRIGGHLAPFGLGGGRTDVAALERALAQIDPADLGPRRRRRSK